MAGTVFGLPGTSLCSYWPDNSPFFKRDGETKGERLERGRQQAKKNGRNRDARCGSRLVRNEITNLGEESQVLASWGSLRSSRAGSV